MTVALHCNCRPSTRGNKSKIYCRRKGIFHKHWHTHQLPGSLTRLGPLWSADCVVSVLSSVRGSHGCSLHLLCQCDLSVSRGSTQTHTQCALRGPARDWCKLLPKHMYILSDILTLAVFSVDTLDNLDSCCGRVCAHSSIHTFMQTDIF